MKNKPKIEPPVLACGEFIEPSLSKEAKIPAARRDEPNWGGTFNLSLWVDCASCAEKFHDNHNRWK